MWGKICREIGSGGSTLDKRLARESDRLQFNAEVSDNSENRDVSFCERAYLHNFSLTRYARVCSVYLLARGQLTRNMSASRDRPRGRAGGSGAFRVCEGSV